MSNEYPILIFTSAGIEIDRAGNVESAVSVLYGDMSTHDGQPRQIFAPPTEAKRLRKHAALNSDCYQLPIDAVHTLPESKVRLDTIDDIQKLLWEQFEATRCGSSEQSAVVDAINACRGLGAEGAKGNYVVLSETRAVGAELLVNRFRDNVRDESLAGDQVHEFMSKGAADVHFQPNTGGGVWLSHSLHATKEGLVHAVTGADSVATYNALAPTAHAAAVAWYDRCGETDDIKLQDYFLEDQTNSLRP